MKEAGEKVICGQSAGELEEKWCKYRDKRWNEGKGGGKNGVPTEGGSARVVHLQPELYSREERKIQGDDRRKNKASNQPQLSYVHKF